MIPDIKVFQIVTSCLRAVRADYEDVADKETSILYYLLNSAKVEGHDKFKWYEQAVEIFITRNKDHVKYLDTRLFFDRERASIPTLHVMMNSDNKGKDGIGIDKGFNEPQVIGDTVREVSNRQFSVDFNIVITSDNSFETVIIYHVMKAMLISLYEHIQLSGFINPYINGRQIQLSQDLAPNGIFSRSIGFYASYELAVPDVCLNPIMSRFYIQMKKINSQTLDEPIGPGPIDHTTELPKTEVKDITNL